MIQDIYPARLRNEFRPLEIREEDSLFVFDEEGRMLLGKDGRRMTFPRGGDRGAGEALYLFSLDEQRFFLLRQGKAPEREDMKWYSIRQVRDEFDGKEVYAAFTAWHLWKWYADNRFCGRCAGRLAPDDRERALRCPSCGQLIFPRINPAVIVGVMKGEEILITRYRNGYAHNALVAGFAEIGETLEETVAREVMEETGIRVKNIRYYKTQPWGMAQDLLIGYYCEAEGDGIIHMDAGELKCAEWVRREDIVLQPNNLSLTNEMMRMFRDNRVGVGRDPE